MTLYKNKYRTESIRLKSWDYSSAGAYFLTIVTKNRKCFFGEIADEKMKLSEIGEIANHLLQEIPNHFDNTELDEWVVMPNHIHVIVIIENEICGSLQNKDRDAMSSGDAINRVSTGVSGDLGRIADNRIEKSKPGGITGNKNPMMSQNISKIIRWYKGRTSFESRKFKTGFAWQPKFYDRIIRNEKELNKFRSYITNNPANWLKDQNYISASEVNQ